MNRERYSLVKYNDTFHRCKVFAVCQPRGKTWISIQNVGSVESDKGEQCSGGDFSVEEITCWICTLSKPQGRTVLRLSIVVS